jgi:hypothetical protein
MARKRLLDTRQAGKPQIAALKAALAWRMLLSGSQLPITTPQQGCFCRITLL